MADYTRQKQVAYNAIKNKGLSIVIKRTVEGNDTDDWNPTTELTGGSLATFVTYSTYGVLIEYEEKHIDGLLIKEGDVKCLIPSYELSIRLMAGDRVLFTDPVTESELVWIVKNPKPVQPNNDPIIYKAQLRK